MCESVEQFWQIFFPPDGQSAALGVLCSQRTTDCGLFLGLTAAVPVQMIRPLPAALQRWAGMRKTLRMTPVWSGFWALAAFVIKRVTCLIQTSFLSSPWSFRPYGLFLAPHLRPARQPSVTHPNRVTGLTPTPLLPTGRRWVMFVECTELNQLHAACDLALSSLVSLSHKPLKCDVNILLRINLWF